MRVAAVCSLAPSNVHACRHGNPIQGGIRTPTILSPRTLGDAVLINLIKMAPVNRERQTGETRFVGPRSLQLKWRLLRSEMC